MRGEEGVKNEGVYWRGRNENGGVEREREAAQG